MLPALLIFLIVVIQLIDFNLLLSNLIILTKFLTKKIDGS
jgi:hypothetical protein